MPYNSTLKITMYLPLPLAEEIELLPDLGDLKPFLSSPCIYNCNK